MESTKNENLNNIDSEVRSDTAEDTGTNGDIETAEDTGTTRDIETAEDTGTTGDIETAGNDENTGISTLSLWDRVTQIPPVKKLLEIPAVGKVLNKETVLYVFVGVLTTLVDYVVFALVNELLKRSGTAVETSSTVATAVAWAAAVIFAYFTNKIYVFESRDWDSKNVVREMLQFFGARVLSGVITLLLMRLLVGWHMNEYLAKILTSVFNLVFNYVASKLLIFKKKE